MRLRRAATLAVAAAAAAVTLTAAVNPQPPPEPPVSLPALTPAALAARYTASSGAVARAAAAAARSGNPALARTLAGLRHQHLLGFDPNGPGEAVEVLGDLATARRVVILVPGSDTSLTTFASRGTASPQGGARALAAQARRLDPGARLAVIAWLGYRTPSLLSPAVLTSGNAGQGAQTLRPLVLSLAAQRRPGRAAVPQLRIGGVRAGRAAAARHRHRGVRQPGDGRLLGGIPAHDGPGVGRPGRRRLDPATCPTSGCWGWGSGRTPPPPSFGARRFGCGGDGHSGYLQPGSASLRNLAYIALGEPRMVTR